MRLTDLTVEVRDKTLKRWGMVDPSLLVLEGTVVHCGVGTWRLTLPADHDLVPLLRTPGSGILVTGPQDVLWSGPTTNPALAISADDPHGTVTISGETDDAILADALAWPTPGAAIGAQGGHDNRSGKAETVMRAYVNANVGPGGALARRGLLAQKLTLAPDLARGIAVVKSARFPVLADLLTEIATVAGLGWRVVQRGEVLVFEVYSVVDRSRFVRFDIANGSLSSQSVEQSPPEQTHVIVAGQNELAARTLIERTTPESIAGMVEWGRRREFFRDQRQTDDLLELQQAGDEILAESGFTATAVKALPSDDQTMLYGVDWREGDRVTVVVDGQETTSTVTAASLSVGPRGVLVGADIGDVSGFDPTSAMTRRVTDTAARVSQLERTAEAASVFDAAVITSGVLDAARIPSTLAGSLNLDGNSAYLRFNGGANSNGVQRRVEGVTTGLLAMYPDNIRLVAGDSTAAASSDLIVQADGRLTHSVPGGSTIPLAHAQAAVVGTVSLVAASSATVAITWPAGRFTVAPVATAGVRTSTGQYVIGSVVATSTSVTVTVRRVDGTSVTADIAVGVVGIQITPTSATG